MDERIYNGLKSKTINIRTYVGGTKFELQQNNELGLPKNSLIVGLATRAHDEDTTASNNLKLVKTAVFQNAFLSLKTQKNGLGPISLLAENYPLVDIEAKALFFEPTQSKDIDWNNSIISIANRAVSDLVNNTVIELVVLYVEAKLEYIQQLDSKFSFRTGEKLLPKRLAHKELKVNETQTLYPLANGTNVGLPVGAYIVGFSLEQVDTPLTGNALEADTKNSTYVTLKRGTESIIDAMPVQFVSYLESLFPDLNYFPIEPTSVLSMDWESSFFQIKDNTNVADGQVFQVTLVWVNGEHCLKQDLENYV